MTGLEFNKDAPIYWHGKPIQIRQKVELRNWEFTLAAIVASSTLLQAIAAMFPFGGDAETN